MNLNIHLWERWEFGFFPLEISGRRLWKNHPRRGDCEGHGAEACLLLAHRELKGENSTLKTKQSEAKQNQDFYRLGIFHPCWNRHSKEKKHFSTKRPQSKPWTWNQGENTHDPGSFWKDRERAGHVWAFLRRRLRSVCKAGREFHKPQEEKDQKQSRWGKMGGRADGHPEWTAWVAGACGQRQTREQGEREARPLSAACRRIWEA